MVLLHPEIAGRSCAECQQWLFDDAPDKFAGKPFERRGVRIPRPSASRPLCFACPKQRPDTPDGARSPETAVEMSAAGWRAYWHYKECRAVGVFPHEDPIVRATAMICREVEEMVAEVRRIKLGVL